MAYSKRVHVANSIYVIGDVHGNYPKLKMALEAVDYKPDDDLIFVGDVMDRGSYNGKVARFIVLTSHISGKGPVRQPWKNLYRWPAILRLTLFFSVSHTVIRLLRDSISALGLQTQNWGWLKPAVN